MVGRSGAGMGWTPALADVEVVSGVVAACSATAEDPVGDVVAASPHPAASSAARPTRASGNDRLSESIPFHETEFGPWLANRPSPRRPLTRRPQPGKVAAVIFERRKDLERRLV